VISPADAVAGYLESIAARGAKPGTIEITERALRRFTTWLAPRGIDDLSSVTRGLLADYQVALAKIDWAAASYNREVIIVRKLFQWLIAHRSLIVDPAVGMATVRSPRGARPAITEDEAARILAAPDPRAPWTLRDRALLELLYSTGLRRGETIALDVADLDLKRREVRVRCGKGDKARVTPLGDHAVAALRAYLELERPQLVASESVVALFVSTQGKHRGQRLGIRQLALRVIVAARRAGLTRRVATHALRRAVATHLLRAGADLRHVQALLGHACIETTTIYTEVVIDDLARVHARTHPRGKLTSE
jgi:integrase/recombinase XerD